MSPADVYRDAIARAERLLDEGRLEDAWAACNAALDSPAEDGRALHIAGILELKRGNTDRAIDTLRRAASVRASDPAVHNSLGETLRIAGQPEQAEGHLRYAVHLDRTLAAAHVNLGVLLLDRGDAENADLCFRNALAIEPAHADALRLLARLRMEQSEPAAAAALLEALVAARPGDAAARLALGEALWAAGATQRALESYRAASEADPQDGSLHFRVACASFELHRTADALAHLDEALRRRVLAQALADPRAAEGRLAEIRTLAATADYTCVGRPQWHRLGGPPEVLAADEGHAAPEPLRSFSDEMFTARLEDVRVLPGELLPLGAGGSLYIDQVASKPLERAYTSRYIMHTCDDGRVLLALPAGIEALEEPAVLLGGAASHVDWLFECLARLWVIEQRPPLAGLRLVVQSGLTAWQKELLRLCGQEPERLVEVPSDRVLQCTELHVASLAGVGHFIAPAAIEHLRRELRRRVPAAAPPVERVYLSRGAASTRRLVNEEALRPMLESHGFAIVDPSEKGIGELLSLLQGAQVVLGVEGAAMAHAFMAPPRATIGMIVAEGLQDGRYWAPSAVLGQGFSFLLAAPDFASSEVHAQCDLTLDPSVLERFLSRLG